MLPILNYMEQAPFPRHHPNPERWTGVSAECSAICTEIDRGQIKYG